MPNNGLIVAWDAIELGVNTSFAGSVQAVSHTASLVAPFTPNSVEISAGITVEIVAHHNESGASYYEATYVGPGAPSGGYTVRGAGGLDAGMSVRLRGVKLYSKLTGALWALSWQSVEVYVKGAYVVTLPGSAVDATSSGVGPSYVPFVGMPPILSVTGRGSGVFTGSGGGGWRFRETAAGPWRTLPVTPPPGISGNLPSVTATSTWGAQIDWQMSNPVGGGGRDVRYDVSQIVLLPNLPKGIRRHRDEGHASTLYRMGMPKASSLHNVYFLDRSTWPPRATNTTTVSELYPRASQFLGVVGDSHHVIEDPLDLPTYCPVEILRRRENNGPPGGGVAYVEETRFAFPYAVDDRSSHPQMMGYIYHNEALARYVNYWGNPLWCYFVWHQDWSDIPYAEYWALVRQQLLHNAALPPSEDRHTRTDLIGGCHEESGHTPFLDAFCGGLRWVGCSRFAVRKPNIPAEKAPDITGADRWTFGNLVGGEWDGEGSLGAAGAVVAPGTTVATMRPLSFHSAPYLYPSICDRVRFAAPTNVANWAAYGVGRDGSEVLLTTMAETVAYADLDGRAKRYAGSWGVDNGAGAVDDLGVDLMAGKGMSSATMASPDALVGFGLLPGRSFESIRYEVVPLDPDQPVTIPYPTFLAADAPPKLVWESGQVCTILYEDGPMVRLGNWLFYLPGFGLMNPPLVTTTYKQTIIDALCTIRLIWEARPHDDGLTTELAQRYDGYEGQSVAVVDKFSVSYPLARTDGYAPASMPFALANTMAEVPPLAMFPGRTYDPLTWERTDAFTNEVWDWAQEPRYLVSQGDDPAHIVAADGEQITTPYADVPSGWAASAHKRAVDNAEASNFKVVRGDKVWARVSPFRGYSAILDLYEAVKARRPVAYAISRTYLHVWGHTDAENNLAILWADNREPPAYTPRSVGKKVTSLGMAYTQVGEDDHVHVAFVEDDIAKIAKYKAGATSLYAEMTLGPGTQATCCATANALLYTYRLDGTTIYLKLFDKEGNQLGPEKTTTISDADDSAIAVAVGVKGNRPDFNLTYTASGVAVVKSSTDGYNYS